MWKDFFHFSRRERQAILLLIVLLAGIFLGKFIFSSSQPDSITELEPVIQEEALPKASPDSFKSESRSSQKYYKPPQTNTEKKRTYYQQEEKTPERPPQKQFPKVEKLAEGTIIELNTADSTLLKKIPGIGSSFAKRIISYKNILGGYHRVEQLQEVYGMYEELYEQIVPYIEINPNEISRIAINSSSLDKLRAHPYLNFYQAKAIIEMRKKKGKVEKIEELKLLEEFSEEDIARVLPYLEF